jgi:hypothetical protein
MTLAGSFGDRMREESVATGHLPTISDTEESLLGSLQQFLLRKF